MKTVSADAKLSGIAQKLPELANELAIVYDMASNLSIACDRYHDPHDQYGGPPTLPPASKYCGNFVFGLYEHGCPDWLGPLRAV